MKPNYVTVIGQGYVGLPLSLRIAEKGNICFGLDSSQELITDLKKRNLINYNSNTAKKLTRLMDNRSYLDRKSTRLNSSHVSESRMPSSA